MTFIAFDESARGTSARHLAGASCVNTQRVTDSPTATTDHARTRRRTSVDVRSATMRTAINRAGRTIGTGRAVNSSGTRRAVSKVSLTMGIRSDTNTTI